MVFFMKAEERLINSFYSCFRSRDWRGMGEVYHPEVVFYDPVFGNLEGPEVGAMWAMLLGGDAVRGGKGRSTELDLQFGGIKGEDGYWSCDWVARYVFPATGRAVVNRGKAMFKFEDGKIIEHQDSFSFWRWSRQALGWKGWFFGWTSLLQRPVRRRARRALERFMKK